VQFTIDTERDSYEQALAALRAAYGVADLGSAAEKYLPYRPKKLPPLYASLPLDNRSIVGGWTERHLFYLVAHVRPGAREVLRYLAAQEGEVPFDQVRAHFAQHPVHPIVPGRLGGTMTSIDAVRRRIAPTTYKPLGRDTERRVYLLDDRIRHGLRHAFAVVSEHPELLRE
jgi:hypothetical protein